MENDKNAIPQNQSDYIRGIIQVKLIKDTLGSLLCQVINNSITSDDITTSEFIDITLDNLQMPLSSQHISEITSFMEDLKNEWQMDGYSFSAEIGGKKIVASFNVHSTNFIGDAEMRVIHRDAEVAKI